MSIVYVALPVALILAIIAVIAFIAQVRSGQFDDLETPPRRMLFDDVEQEGKKRESDPLETVKTGGGEKTESTKAAEQEKD